MTSTKYIVTYWKIKYKSILRWYTCDLFGVLQLAPGSRNNLKLKRE